ncbi:hypothetical protein BASA81_000832 [Batrachochytrium salamandrivorans]|nr:hypothetical protein BASA81_000832 [Batrachochytrium salamandrivorans]
MRTRRQRLAVLMVVVLLGVWSMAIFNFVVGLQPLLRQQVFFPNRQQQQVFFPNRQRLHLLPTTNPKPVEDGFPNPNRLPKLISVGPPSFFTILAPPYYARSPMDGTRNYEPGSLERTLYCYGVQDSIPHGEFPLATKLCSYGPELVFPFQSNGEPGDHSAHLLHDVCLTLNVDSIKQVQRGLMYFDPQNAHGKRCVPCPNPIEFKNWGEHACGVMWNHQINARSLADFQQCYEGNADFIAKIGQRQTPPKLATAGLMYRNLPVLELSFAHSNPGHQCFDSLLSLLPILFNGDDDEFQIIVHQNPTCPDTEWLCALLRQVGLFDKHKLLPYNTAKIPCFANLIVPKWGIARDTIIPPYLLVKLQFILHTKFHFPVPAKNTVLMYAHDTMSVEVNQHRRSWQDMQLAANSMINVHVVKDFAAMTVYEQGDAFFQAQIVIMPHGGQFGNAVFSRPGTIMIELGCVSYSHLGMSQAASSEGGLFGSLPRALGFIHLVVVPCDCDAKELDSNFRFGPESLKQLLEVAKQYHPGSHVIKQKGKKCFGSKD